MELVSRAYNSFRFNEVKNTLTKTSKEKRLFNEANYYSLLPEPLHIFFPRKITNGFNKEKEEYFLELEYYPYKDLGKVIFEFVPTYEDYVDLAKCIQSVLLEFQNYKEKISTDDLNKMYIVKTETEQEKLVTTFEYFNHLRDYPNVFINGIEYENFHNIWPKLNKDILFDEVIGSVIHGDMCFANILYHKHTDKRMMPILKFIDPRGEFGSSCCYGDLYYDLAKLHHSTNTGYEYFINDQFNLINCNKNKIDFCLKNSYNKPKIQAAFKDELYVNYNLQKIKLIEGLIYIGMSARHYDSLDRQKVMYASGIKLLNEVAAEIK